MITQREADATVLVSIQTRFAGRESFKKLRWIQNSLTAGDYMTVAQFNSSIDTLLQSQMIEFHGIGHDRTVTVSEYGAEWLASNFHWAEGERVTLQPNHDDWVMTPPSEKRS